MTIITANSRVPENVQPVHAMIDLETAGVGNSAGIVQCGIVAFHQEAVPGQFIGGSEQEYNINLMSSLMYGGEVDPGTIKFWRDRPAQWPALTQSAYSIPHLLDSLAAFWARFQPSVVWCHGATFDAPILAGYYARAGRATPWKYHQVRCTRTRFDDAAALVGWERPLRATVHLGLADARVQAEDVQASWHAMKTSGIVISGTPAIELLRR